MDRKGSFPDEVRKACPHAAHRAARFGPAEAPADVAPMGPPAAAEHEPAQAESEPRAEAEASLTSEAVEWAGQAREPRGAAAPEARGEQAPPGPEAWVSERKEALEQPAWRALAQSQTPEVRAPAPAARPEQRALAERPA